jgi:hypothetical protein
MVSECLADACRPLGFRVPHGCLPSTTCRPLGFRVPSGWLPSDWFQGASRMESGTNLGLLSPWQSRGGRHTQGEPGARGRRRGPGRGRAHEGEVRTSLPRPPPLPPSRVTARRRGVGDSAARASAVPSEDGPTHASRAGGPRTRTRTRTRTRARVASARKRGARVRVRACARARARKYVRA